jgi:hypothetical protein
MSGHDMDGLEEGGWILIIQLHFSALYEMLMGGDDVVSEAGGEVENSPCFHTTVAELVLLEQGEDKDFIMVPSLSRCRH